MWFTCHFWHFLFQFLFLLGSPHHDYGDAPRLTRPVFLSTFFTSVFPSSLVKETGRSVRLTFNNLLWFSCRCYERLPKEVVLSDVYLTREKDPFVFYWVFLNLLTTELSGSVPERTTHSLSNAFSDNHIENNPSYFGAQHRWIAGCIPMDEF